MATRKQTTGGLILTILVAIALIPKEIWIILGIVAAIAAIVWLAAQWQAPHPKRKQHSAQSPDQPELTLADWMAAREATTAQSKPQIHSCHPARAPNGGGKGLKVPQPSSRRSNLEEVKATINQRNAIRSVAQALTSSGSNTISKSLHYPPEAEKMERVRPGNLTAVKLSISERLTQKPAGEDTSSIPTPAPAIVDTVQSSHAEPPSLLSDTAQADTLKTPKLHARSDHHSSPIRSNLEEAKAAIRQRNALKFAEKTLPNANSNTLPPFQSSAESSSRHDELRRITVNTDTPVKQYSVPLPPEGWDRTRWLHSHDQIEIANIVIRGGLFYTGPRLSSPGSDESEPSLVNGALAVGGHGDYRRSPVRNWLGYAGWEPAERRSYLMWLTSDRTDRTCAIEYVLLFLHGLERRVLIDGTNDPESRKNWPEIEEMLQRLCSAYADVYPYVRRYVNSLLEWMTLSSEPEQIFKAPPSFERSYELPFYIRLALGKCALDRVPVPVDLAISWIRLNPEIPLRTPAIRCAEEFDLLIAIRYQEKFGSGLVLPNNRTKLKYTYRPNSPTLQRSAACIKTFGDVPDITALRTPLKALQELVLQCTEELGAFSRLVGKTPEARKSLEGILMLPLEIWPSAFQDILLEISSEVEVRNLSIRLSDLIERFGASSAYLGREKIKELARALEQTKIGMEPNILEGARAPGENDPIILFSLLPNQSHRTDTQAYQTALLTLQLGSAVAQSDGAFSEHEWDHLAQEIENWRHLSDGDRRRLHAHLELLMMAPMSLNNLRKKLDHLSEEIRDSIAASMVALAQVDGIISPEEVRFLEKVYKALGVDSDRIFRDLHAPINATPNSSSSRTSTATFKLDPERIASLQHETAQVSSLLSDIFADELVDPNEHPEDMISDDSDSATQLIGLDDTHSALIRLMLSRPVWTRKELEDGAADLELMLDGALEQINDASFDAFDIPFTEGYDPLEINPEFIEKIDR